jgi:hypothetical protein
MLLERQRFMVHVHGLALIIPTNMYIEKYQ